MLDKNILRDILPYKRSLIIVILSTILQAIIIVNIFNIISSLMNELLLGKITIATAMPLLVLLLFLFIVRAVLNYYNRYTMEELSLKVQSNIRNRLMKLLVYKDSYGIGASKGEWMSVIIKAVDKVDIYITKFLPQFIILATWPLIFIGVALFKDWISAAIFLVTAPLIPLFMIIIGKIADKENKRQWKVFQYLSNYLADLLPGLLLLKAYNQSESQLAELTRCGMEFSETTLKVLRIAFLSAFMLEFITTLSIAIVAVNIGLRLLYGESTFEPLFFILLMAPQFYQPFRQFGSAFHEAMNGLVASSEIYALLKHQPQSMPASSTGFIPHSSCSIELEHLAYSYGEHMVFEDLSLYIPAGSFIALIGKNGVGKSTIFKLLIGSLLPSQGRILIDNRELTTIDIAQTIGYVSQHPYIFTTSIRENITMGRDILDTQIDYWMDRLNLASVIRELPEGYATILDDAHKLSAGQIRRLGMVRALVGNPKLLLLDEPLENLDIQNERGIRRILHELKGTMTIIIIAHRQDTIDIADEVLTLNTQGVL